MKRILLLLVLLSSFAFGQERVNGAKSTFSKTYPNLDGFVYWEYSDYTLKWNSESVGRKVGVGGGDKYRNGFQSFAIVSWLDSETGSTVYALRFELLTRTYKYEYIKKDPIFSTIYEYFIITPEDIASMKSIEETIRIAPLSSISGSEIPYMYVKTEFGYVGSGRGYEKSVEENMVVQKYMNSKSSSFNENINDMYIRFTRQKNRKVIRLTTPYGYSVSYEADDVFLNGPYYEIPYEKWAAYLKGIN